MSEESRAAGDKNRIGNWFQTYTGKEFYIRDPRPEEINILDIAHALSNQCRFNGHCLEFYSVAQHSILVSRTCEPENALWGLLHDAAEAYCGDIVRPLKVDMPLYNDVESRLVDCVVAKFELTPELQPEDVTKADNIALRTEKRDIISNEPRPWRIAHLKPLDEKIICLPPFEAKAAFLQRFLELTT